MIGTSERADSGFFYELMIDFRYAAETESISVYVYAYDMCACVYVRVCFLSACAKRVAPPASRERLSPR